MPTNASKPGSGPLCFIGSSTEGKPYAKALAYHLEEAELPYRQWDLSAFAAGETNFEALERALDECSFGVLIATDDDVSVSRGKKAIAPRDNVILEYGLFTGRLGRGRSFLLIPSNLKVRLPSDVLGLSILPFRAAEGVDDQRQGMQATADKIVERIQNTGPFEGLSDPAVIEALIDGLKRQIERLPARRSSDGDDPQSSDRIREILNAALDPFLVRTPDAYSVWLRPDDRDGLAVTHSASVPADTAHPRWQRGEGLVGWVWDTGRSAATWKLNRHEKFVAREGCKNESYVCAAVGSPGGPGGVLAIGSDAGFAIKHGDEAVVRAYAAMLALVVEAAAAPASNAPVSRAGLGGAVQDAADFGGKLLSRLPWP